MLKLPGGLEVTYGQINALAGDSYETYEPISDGSSDQDRSGNHHGHSLELPDDRTP